MINMKPERVDMGSDIFYIRRYPPFHALYVLGEIQKIIIPVLTGAGVGFTAGAAENMEADVKSPVVIIPTIISALEKLASNLDGETFEKLGKLLLDPDYVAVSVNRKQAVRLDEDTLIEVFDGRIIDMIALMAYVFRVNFLNFTKSCVLPAGVRSALQDIEEAFRGFARTDLSGTPLSGDA